MKNKLLRIHNKIKNKLVRIKHNIKIKSKSIKVYLKKEFHQFSMILGLFISVVATSTLSLLIATYLLSIILFLLGVFITIIKIKNQ